MDTLELKKEQNKLANMVVLKDGFSSVQKIAGATCIQSGEDILASVVVFEFPSMNLIEMQTFLLKDPLSYHLFYEAYREMPALIEAYNKLDEEPDLILVDGSWILHPRKIGLASHLGLALNKPTIGVVEKILLGTVERGKVIVDGDICGFEVRTREHAKPIYASPGHLVSLGSVLKYVNLSIKYPHKFPEPIHLANKLARKKVEKEK